MKLLPPDRPRQSWERTAARANILEKVGIGLITGAILSEFPAATFSFVVAFAFGLACIAILWSTLLRIRELKEYETDFEERTGRIRQRIESLLRGDP
jgi:hypothetical protein